MLRIRLILILLFVGFTTAYGQISPKKLLKEHKKALSPFKDSGDMSGLTALSMTGKVVVGEVKGDIQFLLSESRLRMEFNLLGASIYTITNDSISWTYSPFDKSFEFKPVEEGSKGDNFSNQGENKLSEFLDNGYKPVKTSKVKLDSIDAYELVIESENDQKSFFFDQTTYYLIGHKWVGEEEYYLNHEIFENRLWPKTYIDITEGGMRFEIDKYELLDHLDPELFEMNEQEKEAYEDYLSQKNKPQEPVSGSAQELYNEGVRLANEGNHEEAIKAYDQALSISNNDHIILNMRGLSKSKLANYYGAIADYERAIEANPEYAEAINNRGLAKYNLSDFKGAIKDYGIALSLDSSNKVFYSNMGLAYFGSGDYAEADNYFSQAIAIDSEQSNYYYLRGVSRAQIENYNGAIEDYKKSISMGTSHQYIYNYYGVSLTYVDDNELALEMFKKAYELDSDNAQYLQNIGDVQRTLERYEASIETFDKLIAQDTTEAYGYAYRAFSEYDLDLYNEALIDINKAISLYSENAYYYDYRGFIREALEEYKGAIADFSVSLSLEPDSNIYHRRGLVKIKIEDNTGACEDFKKAADMDDANGKEALIKYCDL